MSLLSLLSLTVAAAAAAAGVQHVPGDAGGLCAGAPGRPAGLALRAAHPAAQEDGSRPAGLRPGQSPEGAGHYQVESNNAFFSAHNNICRSF